MTSSHSVAGLLVLLSLASVSADTIFGRSSLAAAFARSNLRPYAARHQVPAHAAPPAAHPTKLSPYAARHHNVAAKVSAVKPLAAAVLPTVAVSPVVAAMLVPPAAAAAVEAEVEAAPPAPVAEIPVADAPVADAPDATASVAPKAPQAAVIKQLQDDLQEVKQMHTNVVAVEKTLAADVSLLRESALLERMSKSPKARAAAQQQLRQTERLVKDTEAMVKTSRVLAAQRARDALREAHEVQKAADELSKEASAQLKLAASKPKKAAPAKVVHVAKPMDNDDDSTPDAADDVAM